MDASSALPLVLITLGAVFMPAVGRRLAIPVAIAEVGYGLILGRTGLHIVSATEFTSFLADVGFAFFMFLAGLEIDFRGGLNRRGWMRGVVRLLLSALSFLLAWSLGLRFGWSLWVALAAGATSVGLIVAVLRETGQSGTELGAKLLGQGAVGEALTIIVLSVAHLHHEVHGGWAMLQGIGRMVGLAAVALFLLVAARSLLWWFPRPFGRMVAHEDPSEFGVRVGFGLMFSFIGLSLLAGVEPFLGAFVAGTILTFVLRDKGALEHKLSSMAYGFFVPVFFIHVGLALDLRLSVLGTHFSMVLAIVGTMLFAKLLPTALLLTQGSSLREVLAMSLLLASPLSLVIAIIDLGMRAGVVEDTDASVAIFSGIVASLIYPSLARRLLLKNTPP